MNRNIKIMYLLALLQGLVFYAPIATLYRQVRGLTIAQIALIEGISLGLTLLFEFPWGVVADYIGYRNTMLICNGLYMVSKIVFWKGENFGSFLAERILLAVVFAGLSGVDTSILYMSCEKGNSQKVFSIYNNCGKIGLLIAASIYSFGMGEDYSLAAYSTVITYGIAFFLTFALQEVKNEGQCDGESIRDIFAVWPKLWRNKYLLLLVLAVALFTEVEHTITVFLNQIQYVRCGMTKQQIGIVYVVMTLSGLFGAFSEKGTRYFGEHKFGRTLLALSFLSCVALMGTNSAEVSILAIICIHICFSLFQPLEMELQNRAVQSEKRATELSMNSVLIDAVGVFITVILGACAEADIRIAMGTGAVLCAVSFLLFSLILKFNKT